MFLDICNCFRIVCVIWTKSRIFIYNVCIFFCIFPLLNILSNLSGRIFCYIVIIIGNYIGIYDANGKLLRQESIVDYTKENVRGEYASLDAFIREWRKNPNKWEIRDMLLPYLLNG